MNTVKTICPLCNVETTSNNINRHIGSNTCMRNQTKITKVTKTRIGKNNPMFGKTAWNKGLTKETDSRVKQYGQTIKNLYETKSISMDYLISESRLSKLSAIAKKRNFGGYQKNAGRSKGEYVFDSFNVVTYLQSSFEVQLAKSLNDNNVTWYRPGPLKWVDENNLPHLYYPDFYLPELDVYLDPKNDYLIQKDFFKIKSVRDQNNVNVLVFGKPHLQWDNLKYIFML